MATVHTTAEAAIKASAESNEIVRCERTEANLKTLLAECDDGADGDESEFWGEADDGRAWRVHVAAA